MVDRISSIYTNAVPPSQPSGKSKKSEKTEEVEAQRGGPIAMRLIPDLVDKVEISEAGRMAAAQVSAPKEEKIPEETTSAISNSWYSTGYTTALEEQDTA